MRCVPRETQNIRRRGNVKSAGTGSRQVPCSCLWRDGNRLDQEALRRVLRALGARRLRLRSRFEDFTVFFVLAGAAAAGAVAGIEAPARAGTAREENKIDAPSKNAV